MPSKRRLVTSEICFGTEKSGLLDFSYNKCALVCIGKWKFISVIGRILVIAGGFYKGRQMYREDFVAEGFCPGGFCTWEADVLHPF